MSIIEQAKIELKAANWSPRGTEVMIQLLDVFLDEFDSGGAVAVAAPVLMRLIAGKPLTPLTGEDEEWVDHGNGVFQNKRASSVFKDPRFHDGKLAYDIDNQSDPRGAITFPYWPDRAEVHIPEQS